MPISRISVSKNHRFLVDESGAPFFWLGDTAWEIFHRLTREETEDYLENRRQKGFNVIQAVALAEFDGLRIPNAYGEVPFFDLDPARPNEAYFAHLDWVIARAAQKGLYIGLLPTWGDKVNRMWGQGPQVFDQASARAYGAWIGHRYRQTANIIWILGGDRPESDADGHDYAPVVRGMAAGIQAGVGGPTLMTYHTNGRRSSSQTFHGDDWLDLNMWQSGHHQQDAPNWEMITADVQRTPLKPVLDGEPNYEDHPINPWPQWTPEKGYFRDHDVRKAAYRAVFAGACGHTYGHHSIWQFYDPQRREPVNHPWCDWRTALDRPGAFQVGLLRRLMESRPYLSRIPDQQVLVGEPGAGAGHARAMRDSQGSYFMVYLPLARPVNVRLGLLEASTAHGWWYDPRSGQAQDLGTFPVTAEHEFTPPPGGPDWVLVVDDAGQKFGPSGG